MPQEAWSRKRERQYDHIKRGLLKQGEPEDRAEEIAARTVNKERARAGESKEAQPKLHPGHLVGPAGRQALPHRSRGTHLRPAVQRGESSRYQGPVEDVEGGAGAGRRSMSRA